jgi:hypothetical protein
MATDISFGMRCARTAAYGCDHSFGRVVAVFVDPDDCWPPSLSKLLIISLVARPRFPTILKLLPYLTPQDHFCCENDSNNIRKNHPSGHLVKPDGIPEVISQIADFRKS